jgi:hypothetical protein
MIEFEGNLYYISDGARPVKGRYFISKDKLNGLLEEAGAHYFDKETGALVREAGVYEGYYYCDGRAIVYAGLVEYEGEYYYIIDNAMPRVNQRFAVVKSNGLPRGIYYFGADGKAVRNAVREGFYYRQDGLCIAYQGLVLAEDGYYYYSNNSGTVVRDNPKFLVTNTNGLLPRGYYAFDADGRMIMQ